MNAPQAPARSPPQNWPASPKAESCGRQHQGAAALLLSTSHAPMAAAALWLMTATLEVLRFHSLTVQGANWCLGY